MSKWIRGRLGRPIASTISALMLVSLLLPLAPPPSYAQLDLDEAAAFFGAKNIKKTTPVAVLSYDNKSGYSTGMPGRLFADALTEELQNTGTFDVIKRSEVQQKLDELNLTTPFSWQAQAMVAERLNVDKPESNCNFTISGEVKSVEIRRTSEGTFAEVCVETLVIYRVTKLPINGARVIQRSSPKIGFTGNTDILVQEAMQIAAFQTAQTLLDNRLPIGTILTSIRDQEVVMKGGSVIGFRKGMELVSLRRETITGRLRVVSVTPNDSSCAVLEQSKGVSLGDKAVPIFKFETQEGVTPAIRERAGLQLVAIGGLALLAALVGTNSGDEELVNVNSPTASALSEPSSQPFGANIVRWPKLSKRVIAYIIYRDSNPYAPIAVVDGQSDYYIDSATPLPEAGTVMESMQVSISITPEEGIVEEFTRDIEYEDEVTDLQNPELSYSSDSFEITCRRIPLQDGETCGYRIQTVYMQFDAGGLDDEDVSHPEEYRLYMGNISASSSQVTLLAPPMLDTPINGVSPDDGVYRCIQVLGATNYCLQISTMPDFQPSKTITVPAAIIGQQNAVAMITPSELNARLGLSGDEQIHWRMGAKITGQPLPTSLLNNNSNGWVFSSAFTYSLSEFPPAYPLRSKGGLWKQGAPDKMQSNGRGTSGRGLLRQRR